MNYLFILFKDIQDFSITQELNEFCMDENFNEGKKNIFDSNKVLFVYFF